MSENLKLAFCYIGAILLVMAVIVGFILLGAYGVADVGVKGAVVAHASEFYESLEAVACDDESTTETEYETFENRFYSAPYIKSNTIYINRAIEPTIWTSLSDYILVSNSEGEQIYTYPLFTSGEISFGVHLIVSDDDTCVIKVGLLLADGTIPDKFYYYTCTGSITERVNSRLIINDDGVYKNCSISSAEKFSGYCTLNENIHTSDFSKYNCIARVRDAVKSGQSFQELFENGFIPVQQIIQYKKAYNLLKYGNMDVDEKTFRNGRSGHEDDDSDVVEDDDMRPINTSKMPFGEPK